MLCSQLILHNLTSAQKEDGGSCNLVYNTITVGQTWEYRCDSEKKEQSSVWVSENESAPTEVVRENCPNKKMVAATFYFNYWACFHRTYRKFGMNSLFLLVLQKVRENVQEKGSSFIKIMLELVLGQTTKA